MADLSNLLGDVYGDGAAPVRDELPAWADESRLDELFDALTPGSPDDLVAALSAALAEVPDAPPAAVSQRVTASEPVAFAAAVAAIPELAGKHDSVERRAWQPSDDDILPGSRGRSGADQPKSRPRFKLR